MLRRRLIAFVAALAAFAGIFAVPMAVRASALTTTNVPTLNLNLLKVCLTISAADQRVCVIV